ncbi:MAG: UDP-N-acetylmuramyl-tripeptide synthetase [Candidatus Wolfebacteria bacterium]|nr:UDP-N-acetylmuramyl-tripeptide synthetase [Candidatus Wolfebacteria bacterium]
MNLEKILNLGRKVIPKPVFEFFQPAYHWMLAFLGAFLYGSPSKNMIIIGVTGTKGKTTTCDLIAQILNSFGYKTALVTTALVRIGDEEWKNEHKQTMLGRFKLQKFLSQADELKCRYAVVETSSEGILQYRHRFIDYDVAVFTNLFPEHIERHGGFENYRNAKVKLFEKLAKKDNGIGIYNLDDSDVNYFLEPGIKTKIGYTINNQRPTTINQELMESLQKIIEVKNIEQGLDGSKFSINGERFKTPLIGEFNVYNAVAAITVAISQGVPLNKIKPIISRAKQTPGRLEKVENEKGFTVIIDYAHEPFSLESVYKAAASYKAKPKSSMLCLLGAQGGGRDRWKRPKMGSIAAQYCDKIILTNEDPYDENPNQILDDIEEGVRAGFRNNPKKFATVNKIIDRKEAIQKAVSLAKKGDVVVLTGKGGETFMCIENNKKNLWDEKTVVEEVLNSFS